ncbi:unnamed protein product [Closterium sp. Yama58-4]|nr:unnamed protein product [Closterium sp. Yama58-4]
MLLVYIKRNNKSPAQWAASTRRLRRGKSAKKINGSAKEINGSAGTSCWKEVLLSHFRETESPPLELKLCFAGANELLELKGGAPSTRHPPCPPLYFQGKELLELKKTEAAHVEWKTLFGIPPPIRHRHPPPRHSPALQRTSQGIRVALLDRREGTPWDFAVHPPSAIHWLSKPSLKETESPPLESGVGAAGAERMPEVESCWEELHGAATFKLQLSRFRRARGLPGCLDQEGAELWLRQGGGCSSGDVMCNRAGTLLEL